MSGDATLIDGLRSPELALTSVFMKERIAGEEERVEHIHHMQLAQHFFPSCVCAAVPAIVELLEDTEVSTDGVSGKSYSLVLSTPDVRQTQCPSIDFV